MDFDGVFTNNKVWLNQHGDESVRCDRGDGLAFDLIRGMVKLGQIDRVQNRHFTEADTRIDDLWDPTGRFAWIDILPPSATHGTDLTERDNRKRSHHSLI